ncbi:MAG: NACHT domain-containing protein [Caldilineaceae bacterium]
MFLFRQLIAALAEKQRLLILLILSILTAGLFAIYIREYGAAILIFLLIPIGVAAKDSLRRYDAAHAPRESGVGGDAIIGNVTDSTNVAIGKDIHIHLGGDADNTAQAQPNLELRNWQRNRENVLRNMQNTWIDGYLRHAVHQEIYMLLHKEFKPNALLRRPWNLELQPQRQMVSAETHIYDLYTQYGRNLLILGEPASGKTITLLQLAEMLIIEAQIDPAAPMPVVLNLSSWAHKGLALEEWLAEELLVQYQIARQLTLSWLAQDQLTLLMDGLDEVAPAQRHACVTEINRFKERSSAHLVVCSRLEDYAELEQRLNLTTAIVIQPLMPLQIADYLARFGAQTAGIRAALDHDLELQELAESPLMLSLMPVAYGNVDHAQLLAARRWSSSGRACLNAMWCALFQHRPLPERHPYVQVQALGWLMHLAQGMKRHDLTVFYIERLQPSWLARSASVQSYAARGQL